MQIRQRKVGRAPPGIQPATTHATRSNRLQLIQPPRQHAHGAERAKEQIEHASGTMEPLFEAVVKHIPPPRAFASEGFQLLVANLDYSDYLGRIAFGKIYSGRIRVGDAAVCLHAGGAKTTGKITMIYHFEGLKRPAACSMT